VSIGIRRGIAKSQVLGAYDASRGHCGNGPDNFAQASLSRLIEDFWFWPFASVANVTERVCC
jgi:hypothetical protein